MDDSGKSSLVGRTVAHYRISAVIGAGGMGEVYRATDTKLGRDVALKVLPLDMASDPNRLARFQREARAVAALNHPNVVTVYSVEQSNNVHFITMELIEGQPLDRLISANGLPADRIIEIAGAIAEALAAAHEKGIVHRDLKPANVMVTKEGRVKVLDFGLAKDIGSDTANDATLTSGGRTQSGMVMGTPAYMSPEQVSGRPLDHRSDIFSLGVVLHEMATGRRPFEGQSSAELISSILRDTPPTVTDARPELPSDLARVIRRCLEKDPRYRVQTARDVSNEFRDLARAGARSSAVPTSSARTIPAADSSGTRADEGFWVAVLPFKCSGSNPDLVALAEGLTDDIVTNMSKFSYLRVIARSSTAQYARQTVDVRTAAKELGARYVMEGSIRQAGTKVRIAVQLVDSSTGASLWAETYDRVFTPESMLDVFDDVVPRIVATVGDTQGILPHSMTDALRNRDPESLTPYEALLRSFGFHQHVNASEHLAGITALERAVKQAPDRAECWAMLSWLYRAEYTHGYNPRPDAMERALAAARRAVALASSSQLANAALASAFFFRREFASFRVAAERALALNNMEGYITAFLGMHFAYAGDWERGCALSERSTQLNPHHPGWYWSAMVFNAYRQRDSERALELALRINMPDLWTAQLALTVIYSQLGDMEQARGALAGLLAIRPDFAAIAPTELAKWWLPDMVEQLLSDLRKAGLERTTAAIQPALSSEAVVRTASGESRADEGFWVAVLPFKTSGSNPDLAALAEGLTEDIVTGFSKFSYLKVIARSSTARYARETVDVRAAARQVGARYVMEGSVRQAGAKVRIAVQLIDAASGASLWAELYDRAFTPESVFELQNELVPCIVSTVADSNGVLTRSMSEAVRSRDAEELSPYEAVLRGFGYATRGTAEELSAALSALELAVRKAPSYGDAWGALAQLYGQDYAQGFNLHADSLARAFSAAQRAVELAPTNYLGYCALAQAFFFQKQFQSFYNAAERAVALNPMDGHSVAFLGELLTYTGDWQRGLALAGRAKQLNPAHPGWYWYADFYNAYRKGDYRVALSFVLKVNMPGHWFSHAAMVAAYGQLGEPQAAAKSVRELERVRPDFASTARKALEKWWEPEYVERLIEGWRKAGLEIADAPAETSAPPSTGARVTGSGASRAEEGFWVAVLPFQYTGSNRDLKSLAEGMTEEVTTGLSRFSYLRVIARGSTAKYASESGDIRVIGRELGARYVMEGSVRQAGSAIRVAVRLVDATTGAHLWAENYERTFSPEALFALQDDLVPRVVSTAADMNGTLPRSMSAEVRGRSPEQLTPYEAVLRSFAYFEGFSPEDLAQARTGLEAAVKRTPCCPEALAMLALLHVQDYAQGFELQPDALARGASVARRAIEAAPSNHLAYFALAQAHFFQKEFASFRNAAERTVTLNPMDGNAMALLGELLIYAGETERGIELAGRAKRLNPHHPGWYWHADFNYAYRKCDYRSAVEAALKSNLPGDWGTQALLAAGYAQLGADQEASKALRALIKLRPDISSTVRRGVAKWFDPEHGAHLLEGLRKAGLEIQEDQKVSSNVTASAAQSIAVLPFANLSSDPEQDYFSDGLAEEIINLLAQIPGLKVIARTSAFAFRGREQDIRRIAEVLGVSTVLEGSVRRSGNRIRVTAQLINAADGSHLWSERYDRELSDIFAVQDEISAAISKALRIKFSREAASQRYTPKLEAYEAYLKGKYLQAKVTPESMELARRCYEQASELDPAFGMAHVGLGYYWVSMAHFGRRSVHECVPAARAEARRALQIDLSLADAHALLGYVAAMYDMDWAAAEKHFDFPMAKQASFETIRPLYSGVQFLRGNVEQAIKLAQRAIEEDPLEVWAHMNLHAYLQAAGRDDEALEQLKKVVELDQNQVVALVSMAMIHADKGDLREALKIARRAYAIGSWFPDTIGVLAALTRRNGDEVESKSLAEALGSGEALGDARAHALFHLLCGEVDRGADWAEKAIEQRDPSMMFYLRFVVSKGLRASRRWPKIAKIINLPAEA